MAAALSGAAPSGWDSLSVAHSLGASLLSGVLRQGDGRRRRFAGCCVADTEGRSTERAAAPYGSDLRLYAGIGGIPTLHYGPGDVRFAHAPREQVEIEELLRVTRTLAVLAVRRCGAHL